MRTPEAKAALDRTSGSSSTIPREMTWKRGSVNWVTPLFKPTMISPKLPMAIDLSVFVLLLSVYLAIKGKTWPKACWKSGPRTVAMAPKTSAALETRAASYSDESASAAPSSSPSGSC